MTTDQSDRLPECIYAADRCMEDVRPISARLIALEAEQIEALLRRFIEEGEDKAVSVMLHACAMNQLKLDPDVLCQCIGVCIDLADPAPCFAFQDGSVVSRLLEEAGSEALSYERRIFVVQLATELTIKFELDHQPVRKELWKIQNVTTNQEYLLLVMDAIRMLDNCQEKEKLVTFGRVRWLEIEQKKLLPEQRPKAVVGGTYTVRRSTPKLGRNDFCHCGSGKKYKKCCLAKDQALFSDSSAYEGKTRAELKQNPGLVDDPDIISQMRAYQLKKLKPTELGESQLMTAYQRCELYGLLNLAFEMLLEHEKRTGSEAFDRGHFEDLLMRAFSLDEIELVQQIKNYCAEDEWIKSHGVQFRFGLLEHPEQFGLLEEDCALSISSQDENRFTFDEPIVRFAYDFAHHFPALSIVFARAAITSYPDNELENSMLLELISDARIDLDMEPWGDPVEVLFNDLDARLQQREKINIENKEVKKLNVQLDTTRADLKEKKQALLEMQQTVIEANRKLEKAKTRSDKGLEKKPEIAALEPEHEVDSILEAERSEIQQRLRERVERLKTEIREQQKQRAQLRKKLHKERHKHSLISAEQPQASTVNDQSGEEFEPVGRPTAPEYSAVFRKHCDALPALIAAKAILCAGRFAAQDKSIWQQTKVLKKLPEHYRIRIHPDYRLIVRCRPSQPHLVLDVMPRQQLETWIKRHL